LSADEQDISEVKADDDINMKGCEDAVATSDDEDDGQDEADEKRRAEQA